MTGSAPRRTIAILISGRGSNMRALIEGSLAVDSAYTTGVVFADQPGAAGLAAARDLGVATQVLAADRGEDRQAYDGRLAGALARYSPALIVLAGFMRILSADFVNAFANRILNIHPSLLPKYPGLHTHRRVLAAGETEHGATVHFVTEQLDSGPRVIQARTAIAAGDDEAALAARVQALEHRIYPLAVSWFCQGRLRCADGRAWLDGSPLCAPVQLGDLEHPKAIRC